MTNIKFAIAGTGVIAATMMSTFAKAGIDVTAVASDDPGRAGRFAKAFGIPVGDSNLNSILQRNDVDAVYVANAPPEHAKTCVAALEAGKAVLCEKPMAQSEAEARCIINAARTTQTLCMEGLWTLFLPAYRRFFELSRAAEVGQVKSLIASFGYPVSHETQSHTKAPTGVLLDRGIYLIALALAVFGPVDEVDAALKFENSGEAEAFLQLRHSGGGFSQLSASFTSLLPNTATLSCSRGLIELEAPLIGSETVLTRQTAVMRSELDFAQPSSFRTKLVRKLRENPKLRRINRLRNGSSSKHVPFGSDQYLPQLDHFLGLMRAKTPESDIVPLQFSQDIIRIVDRARSNNAYDRRNLKS